MAARMMIATIMTTESGKKYRSAIDCVATGVGAGVIFGACMTLMAVSEDDCQLDAVPVKVANIV